MNFFKMKIRLEATVLDSSGSLSQRRKTHARFYRVLWPGLGGRIKKSFSALRKTNPTLARRPQLRNLLIFCQFDEIAM